jgi:hypothetical protein
MSEHLCYDSFWGMWAPELVDILNQIAPGDAVNMSPATYAALYSLQRDLEFALDVRPKAIPDHQGHGTNFSPEDEAVLRATVQHVQVGLADDRFDGGMGCHVGAPPGWIRTGEPQKSIVDAIRVLGGDEHGSGPVPPFCPPDGVLGRIRSALGSV